MAGEKTFNLLYKTLNKAQKEAVDAVEGPVMVIAGPGTGKTHVLTLRIANILRLTDTPPDAILALTFTEAAAQSMRRRLVEIVGSDGYRVHFHTFHGFCNQVIGAYPESFPRIIGAAHLTDVDKINIIRDVLSETKEITLLRPFGKPYFYVNPIRQKISELKRENISPEALSEFIARQRQEFESDESRYHASGPHQGKLKSAAAQKLRQIQKNEELCSVYAAYERELQSRGLYDYEDMIVETVKALETDEDLLRTLQEEYQYILADEHQDANAGQNRLLELLASFHDEPNLFVVGDEKQAIYRFQGASVENFTRFQRTYPQAKQIELTENYRSPQKVLDAAHTLITTHTGETPLRKPLHGKDTETEHVRTATLSSPEYELRFIANDIIERIEAGAQPEEIAVLYRTNREADAIVRVFEQLGVPFTLESEQNVLADTDIRKFITLLRAIAEFGNDQALTHALHIDFLDIPPLDVYRLIRYARAQQIDLHEALRLRKHRKAAGVTAAKKLETLAASFNEWKRHSENEPLTAFFERVAHESGFIAHLVASAYASDKIEKLHALFFDVQTLFAAHSEYTLHDYLTYLDVLEEHGVTIAKTTGRSAPGAIRLMTAHKAKGLEFDHVYIVGLADGQWGNRRRIEHFNIPFAEMQNTALEQGESEEEDERRLFYVGLTRAKSDVTLTYASTNTRGNETLPSQFLGEVGEVERHDSTEFESGLSGVPLVAPRTAQGPSVKEQEYLQQTFLEQGLSVTALNNFLRCPWQYFYRNLIRVPEVPDKHLLYGTAVHRTLKEYFDNYRVGEHKEDEWLVQRFTDHLNKQPLSRFEYDEALEKGTRALVGYVHSQSNWEENIVNELRLAVEIETGDELVPRIGLRGDLDKVEFLDDGGVNVVDYKTGKPKSRNHILGNTKADNAGDFYRQLVFYKLLMDGYKNGVYPMRAGEIDFVEPDERGRFRRESFDIDTESVTALQKQIADAVHQIYTLSFWDSECEQSHCRYCEMRRLMN